LDESTNYYPHRQIDKVTDANSVDKLLDLEKKLLGATQYKFGVIYRKKGQVEDDDMMSNGT
jgi:hypothetical protein